jgi:cyanate permease
LKRPGPWWIALAFGCYAFNYYAIMVWLPTFMVGERQTPLLTASLLTALVVAVNIPGNLLGGMLMQRGVARGTNVCIAGVATALTALMIFSPALPDSLRFFGCVLFSFAVGVLPGSVMSAAQTHAANPAQVGTIQGMINQGSNMGQFVSPLLVTAVVGTALAWNNMLLLLLATSAIIIACGLMIRRIEARLAAAD